MLPVDGDVQPTTRLRRRSALAIAVATTCCIGASAALAQNIPYQSGLRSQYGNSLGQADLPPGLTLEPRVEAAIQYADNVNVSSSGGEGAFGIELAPGAYAAYNSERFKGAADYSLIGRLWDDGSLDDITNKLMANGRWVAVPDLLFISGRASYGDVLIDEQQGGNYGNLGVFNSGNIAEQAMASISPMLRKQFNDFEFQATYSYGQVWYLDEGKGESGSIYTRYARSDSENQHADVRVGLLPDARRYSGRIFYSWDHSEFETSIPYEFERLGFEGSMELSRTLSVVGDIGKESALDVNTSAGGLDSDFWSAGLLWSSSKRTSAEARYGERFFGPSYYARIRHTARMFDFSASYSESPDVETYQYNFDALEPGDLPPWFDPNTDLGQFSSQPYVGKNARVAVTANGRRTTLGFRAYNTERAYLSSLIGDEHTTGIALIASRTLAANASVDVRVSYTDRERGETTLFPTSPLAATQDYDTEFTVRANREFGPRLTVSLESGIFNHAGTSAYDGWWIGLRGRWLPAFGR